MTNIFLAICGVSLKSFKSEFVFFFRFFGGLIDDVKRKLPFYRSDVKDALHVQCIASFVFLYFACLTPIITFGGLLGDATDNSMVSISSKSFKYAVFYS